MADDQGTWDVVVIGAGAAGLCAGIWAARAGARVLALEGGPRVGTKILASGGGRCNLLPTRWRVDALWSHSAPEALPELMARWPLPAVRAFFERDLGLALRDEAEDKVFPASGRAGDVVVALLSALSAAGATLRTGARVRVVEPEPTGAFTIALEDGEAVRARRVIVTCGGLSLPRSGSDGFGLRLAAALGHGVAETYPALVPLTLDAPDLRALAGVSCPAWLRVEERGGRIVAQESGAVLFTHRGLSGPATLQIAHHLVGPGPRGRRLRIGLGAPALAMAGGDGGRGWASLLQDGRGGRTALQALRVELPQRLADALLARAGVQGPDRLAGLARDARASLLGALTALDPIVTGSEGFKTAEVTGGGVSLAELEWATLQSSRCAGLHFAGETVDVTGRLGGFNFLWAFVSGRVAGEAAARPAAVR